MPTPPVTRRALEAVIALAVGARAEKGYQLFAGGAVQEKDASPKLARFWVYGGTRYEVVFRWMGDRVEPACDCPDAANGFVCKHAAAVAYALLGRMEPAGAEEDAATRRPSFAEATEGRRGDAATPETSRVGSGFQARKKEEAPRVSSEDPVGDRWLASLAALPSPGGAPVFWSVEVKSGALQLTAYAGEPDRRAGRNPLSRYALLALAPRDPVAGALDPHWGERPPFRPLARLLEVLSRERVDMRWFDDQAPVEFVAAPLALRVHAELRGDALLFTAYAAEGREPLRGASAYARVGDRWLVRAGKALRVIEAAPEEVGGLLGAAAHVGVGAFAARGALAAAALQPYLDAPLPDIRAELAAPLRVEAIVEAHEGAGDQIALRSFVRYVLPQGEYRVEPPKTAWSKPQERVVKLGGRLVRFKRDPAVENRLAGFKLPGTTLHPRFAAESLAKLRDACDRAGVTLETNGLEEAYRVHELPWVAKLRLSEEKNTRLLSLYLAAGGVTLDAADVLAAWRTGSGRVRVPGHAGFVALPAAVNELLEEWRRAGGGERTVMPLGLREAFDAVARYGERLDVDPQNSALLARVRGFAGMPAGKPSRRFKTELRPYQARGLAWLLFLREFGLGGILADDMGLGKTVQSLAFLDLVHAKKEAPPSLILAPASVALNWQEECARFVPHLKVAAPRSRRELEAILAAGGFDLLLLSYNLATLARETFLEREFSVALFDEGQALKNKLAERNKVARALRAATKVALTGTPMENHVGEYQAILDCVQAGFLGDGAFFENHFRTPIERHGDKERLAQLRRMTAPLVLRRTKEVVVKELPPKTEMIEWIELGDAQRKLYDGLLGAYRKSIVDRVAKHGFARSKLHVLEVLLRLRQAACATRLLPPDLATQVDEAAKLEALDQLLADAVESGHKVLVFSQFVELLTLVRERLPRKLAYAYLDGSTRERMAQIKRFQTDDECRLFLISLHAGGRGINLTAADYVVFLDPWWNPAVEDQARDRAHRIGQDKQVFVYRLAAKDTVEEVILKLQDKKRALFQALVDGNEAPLAESLSAQDVAELFGLPVDQLR